MTRGFKRNAATLILALSSTTTLVSGWVNGEQNAGDVADDALRAAKAAMVGVPEMHAGEIGRGGAAPRPEPFGLAPARGQGELKGFAEEERKQMYGEPEEAAVPKPDAAAAGDSDHDEGILENVGDVALPGDLAGAARPDAALAGEPPAPVDEADAPLGEGEMAPAEEGAALDRKPAPEDVARDAVANVSSGDGDVPGDSAKRPSSGDLGDFGGAMADLRNSIGRPDALGGSPGAGRYAAAISGSGSRPSSVSGDLLSAESGSDAKMLADAAAADPAGADAAGDYAADADANGPVNADASILGGDDSMAVKPPGPDSGMMGPDSGIVGATGAEGRLDAAAANLGQGEAAGNEVGGPEELGAGGETDSAKPSEGDVLVTVDPNEPVLPLTEGEDGVGQPGEAAPEGAAVSADEQNASVDAVVEPEELGELMPDEISGGQTLQDGVAVPAPEGPGDAAPQPLGDVMLSGEPAAYGTVAPAGEGDDAEGSSDTPKRGSNTGVTVTAAAAAGGASLMLCFGWRRYRDARRARNENRFGNPRPTTGIAGGSGLRPGSRQSSSSTSSPPRRYQPVF